MSLIGRETRNIIEIRQLNPGGGRRFRAEPRRTRENLAGGKKRRNGSRQSNAVGHWRVREGEEDVKKR